MLRKLVAVTTLAIAFAAHAQEAGEDVPPEEAAPAPSESVTPTTRAELPTLEVRPFIAVAGGPFYHHVVNREDIPDTRESRFTTIALSRLGARARWGEHVTLESEFEVNAGPYGTSVWEGQAALQVRNQLIRLNFGRLVAEVGRVTDGASVDFVSGYAVGNLLLTDDLARWPMLISGFNRGNGVLARYELMDGLRLGLTVNAGNPTSTTGTVMIGGTFPPFARFYEVPWSHVGRDARGFPTSSFHAVLASPAVLWESEYLHAQAAVQWFDVNTNTNSEADEHIGGYNVRGGVMGLLGGGRIRPFVNASRVLNDVVSVGNTGQLSADDYEAITASGGLDYDVASGVGLGAQYNWVHEQQGDATEFVRHIGNVGASYALAPQVSLDARYGISVGCEDDVCNKKDHFFYLTMKAVLGAVDGAGRRP